MEGLKNRRTRPSIRDFTVLMSEFLDTKVEKEHNQGPNGNYFNLKFELKTVTKTRAHRKLTTE